MVIYTYCVTLRLSQWSRGLHGVAIKKPDCFYYSFPATSITKRRVGHWPVDFPLPSHKVSYTCIGIMLSANAEQCVNIKFLIKLGKSATETYNLLTEVYGDQCLSRTQVFEWFKKFKDGRELRRGRSKIGPSFHCENSRECGEGCYNCSRRPPTEHLSNFWTYQHQ